MRHRKIDAVITISIAPGAGIREQKTPSTYPFMVLSHSYYEREVVVFAPHNACTIGYSQKNYRRWSRKFFSMQLAHSFVFTCSGAAQNRQGFWRHRAVVWTSRRQKKVGFDYLNSGRLPVCGRPWWLFYRILKGFNWIFASSFLSKEKMGSLNESIAQIEKAAVLYNLIHFYLLFISINSNLVHYRGFRAWAFNNSILLII